MTIPLSIDEYAVECMRKYCARDWPAMAMVKDPFGNVNLAIGR